MKNKKTIIGIICGILLIVATVVIALLLGNKPKEESKPKDVKQLNEKRTYEGFEFTDATIQQTGEMYEFIANVTAKDTKESYTRVVIWYYDKNEKEVGAAICALPQLSAGETATLACSTDNNISIAVDYKVLATEKEISELKQS